MEKVINHEGKVVMQHSVAFFKDKLRNEGIEFLEILANATYEWGDMHKAAIELIEGKETT